MSPSRRTTGRVLVAVGASCLVGAALPVVTAAAANDPGSGFGSFALAANAPAVQVRQVDGGQCGGEPAATGGCEGVVPEAVSTLNNGPVGYALSSVVWPGVLAGNLGSLIIVAGGGQAPPETTMLNSPIRAEARSGGDGKPVVNDDFPGTRMVAQAQDTRVSAEATVTDDVSTPGGTVGQSSGRTVTEVTGPRSAVAQARSSAKDLSLAGGVVTIGAVTSEARATTDGAKADATGKTVTSGVEIGGVPVSIDERGVTVQGTSAPLNSAAAEIVNTAISNAGMTIAVSQPSKVVDGASVQYDSGSVIFFWQQQPGVSTTVILGGTRVTASASEGFEGAVPDLGTPVEPPSGPIDGGTTTFTPGSPGFPGTPAVPGSPGLPGTEVAGPDVAAPGTTVAARERLGLPTGLPLWLALLGLVGVGLLAAGLRRLPDRILEVHPSTACLIEETA